MEGQGIEIRVAAFYSPQLKRCSWQEVEISRNP
jgi:hypothetical protein